MFDVITLLTFILTSSVMAALVSGITGLVGVKLSSSHLLKIEESKQRYDLLKYRRELILEAYRDYCKEKEKFDADIRSSNAFELLKESGDPGNQFLMLIADHYTLIKARCIKYLVVFSDEHVATLEAALREISDTFNRLFEDSLRKADSTEDIHQIGTLGKQNLILMTGFDDLYFEVLKDEMKSCFANVNS